MVELTAFLRVLEQNPAAFRGITLENLMKFVIYAGKLKNDILIVQPAEHPPLEPPDHLPRSIESFLNQACGLVDDQVSHCWAIVKDMVWSEEPSISEEQNTTAFREHGYDKGISRYSH